MKGKVIANKYRISTQLGLGGMGTVFRAQHQVLERESAIKILHPQLNSDNTFVERFMREARAMARLDHENIIRIYDVFQDDNIHFIAMELFDGASLKTLIEKGDELPVSQVISIILQCARGLAYAHAQGIVHRDIKPSNIMINAQGLIKITDFGIAAAVDDSATLTSTGQLVGTPRYMSPEQARNEPVDRRSDIYALGMVAYELLTGSTPFEGDSGVAIIGKLAYENAELNLQFPQRVPEKLQLIVKKMLARSADDRFSHATHLMQALKSVSEELGEDEATLVLPVSEKLKQELELEPKYADTRFGDPLKTTVIKNPPARLNTGSHKSVKKPWSKSKKIGGFSAALSIVIGIAIGVVLVFENPELNFDFTNKQGIDKSANATVRKFNELLILQNQMLAQKTTAQDWQGDSLAAEPFSRAIDKELIASESIPAIRRHIEKHEDDAAMRDITTATLLMKGAFDLYRESAHNGKQESKKLIFKDLETARKKTQALDGELSKDNVSPAARSNYAQADKAVKEANDAYAKLEQDWETLSYQQAQSKRDEIQKLYQVANNLLGSMKTYAQQEDILNNIYAIRAHVRELRGAISSAEDKARQHHAEKFVAADFNKARRLNGRLGSMLVEADQSLKVKNYSQTKSKLEQSIQVAQKTLVLFENAATTAVEAEARVNNQRKAELAKIEAEKQAREKELAALKAEQAAQDLAAKQEQQRARELAERQRLRAKPTQKDVVAVEKMLSSFKQAIEDRNLAELRKVADISDNHLKIVTDMFTRFDEVHLSVTSYALSRSGATANFRFEKLVTANGDRVLPSASWQNGKLEMVYSDKGWEKIRWY